jgi:hypothetical protein
MQDVVDVLEGLLEHVLSVPWVSADPASTTSDATKRQTIPAILMESISAVAGTVRPAYRHSIVGVIHSGQCFCPSRTPQRNGNIKGRGTPLPSCADCFLLGLPGTALASVTLAVASRATD